MAVEIEAIHSGRKDDSGKLRYDLLPPDWLDGLAQVITHGAEKYGDNNWQQVPHGEDRYYAAAMRHINSLRSGNVTDTDSGIHHAYHAAIDILMWAYHIELNKEDDYIL